MARLGRAQAADWLRRVPARGRGAARHPRRRARPPPSASRETGRRGEGGDRTLVIDADAEEAVFAELDELHARAALHRASARSAATVDFGDAATCSSSSTRSTAR